MGKGKEPRIYGYELFTTNPEKKISPSEFCNRANAIATRYLNINKIAKEMSKDILRLNISAVNELIAEQVGQDRWLVISDKPRISVSMLSRYFKASFPKSASKVLFKISYAANKDEKSTKKRFFRTFSTKRALISLEIIRTIKKHKLCDKIEYSAEDGLHLAYIGILLGMLSELRSLRVRDTISLIRKYDTAVTVHNSEDQALSELTKIIQYTAVEKWKKNPFQWHNQIKEDVYEQATKKFEKEYKKKYGSDIPDGLERRIREELATDAIRDVALELNLFFGVEGQKMPNKADKNEKLLLLAKLDKIKEGLDNGTFPPKRKPVRFKNPRRFS